MKLQRSKEKRSFPWFLWPSHPTNFSITVACLDFELRKPFLNILMVTFLHCLRDTVYRSLSNTRANSIITLVISHDYYHALFRYYLIDNSQWTFITSCDSIFRRFVLQLKNRRISALTQETTLCSAGRTVVVEQNASPDSELQREES